MHRILRRALISGLFTAGFLILGAEAASAATDNTDNTDNTETQTATTSGAQGIASGNQVLVGLETPIDVSGNAVSVVGDARADSAPVAQPAKGPVQVHTTTGKDGTLSGNQAVVGVHAPVSVRDQAVAVVGDSSTTPASTARCDGGGRTTTHSTTSGENGIVAGNQVVLDVSAPIDVTGNAVSVVGDASASRGADSCAGSAPRGSSSQTTSGANSVLGGNQVVAPVTAPVDATGNAVAVLGDASSATSGGAGGGTTSTGTTPSTDGTGSVGGGNQVVVPLLTPTVVRNNAVAVIGDATVIGGTADDGSGGGGDGDGDGDGEGDGAGDGGAEVAGEEATTATPAHLAGRVLPKTGIGLAALGSLVLGLLLLVMGFGLVVRRPSAD